MFIISKSIVNTISSEKFLEIVSKCFSVSEILEYFGFSKSSGSMAKIVKHRIIKENADISHFRKRNKNGGSPKYTLEEILVENSKYTNMGRLKRRILKSNLLKYECESCGNKGIWNDKPLVLQLEHKNGKHNDNRLSNLCFLCPNCHSQTDTFSGKNANKSRRWDDFIDTVGGNV